LPGLVAAQTFQPATKRRANFLRRLIPEILLDGRQIIHGALPNLFRKTGVHALRLNAARMPTTGWIA
jgi:hypothetical protein